MAFYKKSKPRDDGTIGWSGYDHADTVADAIEGYKRCRNRRTFILTPNSPDRDTFVCVRCGKALSDPAPDSGKIESAYIDYAPKAKRAWPHHYSCAWANLLGAIGASYNLAQAAATLENAEGRGVVVER